MPLPPKLTQELDQLRAAHKIDVYEDPQVVNLVFVAFPVGDGFNRPACDLLIRIPRSYPDAGPDMFWTTVDLLLAGSKMPQCAEAIETYIGRQWRRFSWHRKSWNSVTDNIQSYLEFVKRRLRQKQ